MLNHQTIEKLRLMKLPAMAAEAVRQTEVPAMDALDFDERVGMLIDAEWSSRQDSRVKKLVTGAKLRDSNACFADLDFRPSRKFDRAQLARLSDFSWVKGAKNLLITGCTGTGKTYLACAFGQEACRKGMRVAYFRAGRLFDGLRAAQHAGTLQHLLLKLKKTDLLILDDWGLVSFDPVQGRLLLEVMEDRYAYASSIVAAQLPVAQWHAMFEDPTAADAVLDRLVHNAYRFELQGPSLRRPSGDLKQEIEEEVMLG